METQEQDTYENTNEQALAPRSNQLARRDFSGSSLAIGNAATDALVAKARADTEARWIMAMRRPRNMDDVRQLMLKECRRPGFADAAVYSVPRGGAKIEGLSIRFAEVAVRCMGNLQPEVVTIYDDTESRIVRCTVTDYESNVTWSKDLSIKKTVERKHLARGQRPLGDRVNSYGDRVYIVEATDDDVQIKEAAAVSKALRTLILRCIPGHLQDECLALCNKVMADKAAKDPDAERVKVLDAFAAMGVLPSEVEDYLGHTTERMSPAEVQQLRKLYGAIADGHISWAEALLEVKADRAKPQPSPAATPAAQAAPAAAPSSQAAPGAAPAVAPAPAPTTAPAASQVKPATKTGKGTAALKSKLDTATDQARERDAARAAAAPAPAAEAKTDPEAEPGWMSGQKAEADPDVEERACAGCGVPIDAKKSDPPGGKCYACLNA